jgi:outer membrane protein assembly factor BamC
MCLREGMGVNRSLLLLVSVALLTGCSWLGIRLSQDTGPEKGKTTSLPPLEVPPDLTVPDFDTRLSIPNEPTSEVRASRVRPPPTDTEPKLAESARVADEAPALDKGPELNPGQPDTAKPATGAMAAASPPVIKPTATAPSMRIQQAGSARWLEVGATPSQIMPKLKAFLKDDGWTVARTDTKAGVVETAWHVESTSDSPNAAGSPQTREKYRVRLQRETGAVTNIYIAQLSAQKTSGKKSSWKSIPADPQEEASALDRLAGFLGGSEAGAGAADTARVEPVSAQHTASAPESARLEPASPPRVAAPTVSLQDIAGVPALIIQDDYGDAWNLTEGALSRSGLKVENRDRNRGLYFVRAVGKGSGQGVDLKPGGKFQLHLLDQGNRTLVTAHSDQDKALEQNSARAVLTRIKDALQSVPPTTAQNTPG